MILVIDIGNTTIEFGIYNESELIGVFRLGSKRDISSDEVGLFASQFFDYRHIAMSAISDVVISSVVPQLNYSVTSAIKKYFGLDPYVIGENLFCEIPNLYENPKEVGIDRLVDAYAAVRKYGAPIIVVDFGTATTYDLVGREGNFQAGITAPGVRISAEALSDRTAMLPKVEIKKPRSILAQETISSMQAGIFYGQIGQTEYIIKKVKEESGYQDLKVVATGGLGRVIAEETDSIDVYDSFLTLDGLYMIYEKNRKQERQA